jgi:hypothetical protein
LFFRRSVAVFTLNLEQGVDGVDVAEIFRFRAALAKLIVLDTEVGRLSA